MPRKYPPEFKTDVAAVARRGDLTVPGVTVDFGVSQDSVRHWVRYAEVDDGVREGKTSAEESELVQSRRDKRRLEMDQSSPRGQRGSLPQTQGERHGWHTRTAQGPGRCFARSRQLSATGRDDARPTQRRSVATSQP